ncbi:MAG: cob(I)yrinic acid a,c-diamide adenosyltransferase [Erysipelotrichales bacterium]
MTEKDLKVYTGTGDKKTTGLIIGRIEKSSLRIDCYGTTDEALSYVGQVYNYVENEQIQKQLEDIMSLFFLIGQDLANPKPTERIPWVISEEDISRIEGYIDFIDGQNTPLSSFILPVGVPGANFSNTARTIVRRAERKIVLLSEHDEINLNILPLINRLSDYFFVLSRFLNKEAGCAEREMIFPNPLKKK